MLLASSAALAASESDLSFHYTDEQPAAELESSREPAPVFGQPGRWWGTIHAGGSLALGTDDAYDVELGFEGSTFIVEDLELLLGISVWYIDQEVNDAFALNLSVTLRWHFINDTDRGYSVFADIGSGALGSTEDVPDYTSPFNFASYVGVGGTLRLGESENRLVFGTRWRHVSNAGIDDHNPGRDALLFYMGIQFPF